MARRNRVRPVTAAVLLGVAALAACTNSGTEQEGTEQGPAISGRNGPAGDQNAVGAAPSQSAQTRAEPVGAIGPGNTAGTSNVNPTSESTKTQVDSTPDTRPNAGPGSE